MAHNVRAHNVSCGAARTHPDLLVGVGPCSRREHCEPPEVAKKPGSSLKKRAVSFGIQGDQFSWRVTFAGSTSSWTGVVHSSKQITYVKCLRVSSKDGHGAWRECGLTAHCPDLNSWQRTNRITCVHSPGKCLAARNRDGKPSCERRAKDPPNFAS